MNSKLLLLFDKILGLILLQFSVVLRFKNKIILNTPFSKKSNKVLIIKFLGAGNWVAISDVLPTANLDIVTTESCVTTIKELHIDANLYTFNDKNGTQLIFKGLMTIFRLIFSNYRLVVNLEIESNFAKFIATAPLSEKIVGISNRHASFIDSFIYDFYLVSPELQNKSSILSSLLLYQPFSNKNFQVLNDFHKERFVKVNGDIFSSAKKITIAPTCSTTDALRRLDIALWREFIMNNFSSSSIKIVFPSYSDPQYEEFKAIFKDSPKIEILVTSFKEFIFSIKSADLVITIDSQALHLSQLLRIPAVSIYGPTSPYGVGISDSVYPITKSLICSPCTHKYLRTPCNDKAYCMEFSREELDLHVSLMADDN